jgi:hypothetical protein
VKLEAKVDAGTATIDVSLPRNNGSDYTSVKSTDSLATTDTIYTLGGSSDLWSETGWTYDHFSNVNFRLRLTAQTNTNTISVDAITVKALHHIGGGTPGGGEIFYWWRHPFVSVWSLRIFR